MRSRLASERHAIDAHSLRNHRGKLRLDLRFEVGGNIRRQLGLE